ncbi:hypothetical protein ACTFIT_007504 [Dictyostelium discoideum]
MILLLIFSSSSGGVNSNSQEDVDEKYKISNQLIQEQPHSNIFYQFSIKRQEIDNLESQISSDPDSSSLPSDIRSTVLATIVKNGGEADQQIIIDQYLKSSLVAEKNSYLLVLALAPKEELVEKALNFALSPSVRSQDSYMVFFTLPNRVRQFAWAYFTKNFNQIDETFNNSPLFGRIIGSCLTSKMDDSQYNEVVNFFKDHPVPIADRSIKQDLEMVTINSNWFKAFNQDLSNWIQSK